MKSVLHLRIDSPGYSSDAIERAFRELGYTYFGFNWQHYRFENGVERLREYIIGTTASLKPDIVFANIQNPEALDLKTWQELSKHSFVINYTFDVRDPERMQWMYDAAPHIGFTFFASQEDVLNCQRKKIYNIGHSYSSIDMGLYKPKAGNNNYAFDVVFCGTNYVGTNLNFPLAKERQEMIEFLSKNYGDRFMAYGLGQKGGLIRPEVEASVYNHSKIAINQNNFNLENYTSDRLWRIMASGTMCITKYFKGIEKMFQKEIHLDWFYSHDEMLGLIEFYLHDDKERQSIAEAGCRLVRGEHTWKNRIEKMESLFEKQLA